MGVLIREVMTLYAAYFKGLDNPLPLLTIQYKDYAAWQNAQLESREAMPHQKYWLQKLSGKLQILNLLTDYPRPPMLSYEGKSIFFSFENPLLEQLKALAQQYGASLFMTLTALTKVLLYRYTEQEEIIIGTPIAGRNHPDLEQQIGFFVNTLALRDTLTGADSFVDVLKKVKHTAEEAYEHALYPFDRLVNELNLIRDMSRAPIFDVMVVLQNIDYEELRLGDIKISEFDNEFGVAKYDLIFEFAETPDQLQLVIRYSTKLFGEKRIQNTAGHLKQLVINILRDSQRPISRLNMLSETEKQHLLVKFNDTMVEYSRDKTIVDLFEEQVERIPNEIAILLPEAQPTNDHARSSQSVISNQQSSLTYRELNEQANRIAHYLREEHHIQPEDLVGVLLDRSEWIPIVILGILKAGGAYVPVDSEYPVERIRYIIEDSGCSVILSEKRFIEGFSDDFPAVFLDVHSMNSLNSTNPSPRAYHKHLAYVIYTSGSTGRPKGCQIEMGNLCHYLRWAARYYFHDDNKGNFGLYSSLSFDLTVSSLFLPLIRGKILYIFPQETEVSDILVESFNGEHEIDCIKLTPSHISLLQHLNLSSTNIRLAIIGGEALSLAHVRFLYGLNAQMEIYNEYGPTEATVGCIIKKIEPEEERMLIGKPIDNTHVYILDRYKHPVPEGIPGEIYIGGPGVSRGYVNLSELQGERFIESPFLKGERIYKTGDQGVWLPDGNIDFLGRNDDQVKIRGYRIELGEIEKRLLEYESIKKVIVLAKYFVKSRTSASSETNPELVAYVVGEESLNVRELREYLKNILPEYMIPAYFVKLQDLPLNQSGKVNKEALPDPTQAEMKTGTDYIAPRNETEEILARLWSEVLGKQRVGIQQNFFELGGHSLNATLLASRIHKEMDIKISLRDMFQSPTISELSTIIQQRKPTSFIQIHPVMEADYYALSHAQR
jgi:amino acid adenylation domain-containing protein